MPDIVVSHFHLREGDVVADFGAGSGHFLPLLAKRVGPHGKVYACEIQKALVENVGTMARSLGLLTIYPLWCDLEESGGIGITDGELDSGVLVNTLFQIEDKLAALQEMYRTIRSGGKLMVIDWTDAAGGLGPIPDHVVTTTDATALAESVGFVLENEFPAGSHHYGLAFRKL